VEYNGLLSEQVGEYDDGIAFRAGAAQTKTTHEGVAVRATLIADGTCVAGGAFVHRVLEKIPPSLEFGTNERQVQTCRWVMA
jgi:hypothetical protein